MPENAEKAHDLMGRGESVLRWRLDEDLQPVRLARQLLDETLTGWNALCWQDNGRIVTSELVTNAVRHGTPPLILGLSIERDQGTGEPVLVIAVTDASTTTPEEREPGDQGGFGLTVLHSLAAVSVQLHQDGKTVRAVIPYSKDA